MTTESDKRVSAENAHLDFVYYTGIDGGRLKRATAGVEAFRRHKKMTPQWRAAQIELGCAQKAAMEMRDITRIYIMRPLWNDNKPIVMPSTFGPHYECAGETWLDGTEIRAK